MTTVPGTILVTGATGRQGGAVARALLADGWRVRALTRSPDSDRSKRLAVAGAEVVAGDMEDPSSLDRACQGAHGVYSVQNHQLAGLDGEVRQGRNVADAAVRAGVRHLVYGSAGPGQRGTGVGSWETKLDVEEHIRTLGLPTTVLRPAAFMELMTDRAFYPAAGIWHVWPRIAGGATEIPWLCCDDLGVIAARVFADRDGFVGRDLNIAAEWLSLDGCRAAWTRVMGRAPRRFPVPVWLFGRFSPDTLRLWRWTRDERFAADLGTTRRIHPAVLSVEDWLRRHRLGA